MLGLSRPRMAKNFERGTSDTLCGARLTNKGPYETPIQCGMDIINDAQPTSSFQLFTMSCFLHNATALLSQGTCSCKKHYLMLEWANEFRGTLSEHSKLLILLIFRCET